MIKAMIFTNLMYYIITTLKILVHQYNLYKKRKLLAKGELSAEEAALLKTARVNRTSNS
jgi:hypothetical protein